MAKEYILKPTQHDDAMKHGQPPAGFNRAMRTERGIDEMLGLCKGIIADGIVTEAEAKFLFSWAKQNPEVCTVFPGKLLIERLNRIFLDCVVTDEERADLKDLLESVTGQTEKVEAGHAGATRALFKDSEPTIEIPGRAFSFTGKFVSGTRTWCAEQVTKRGGLFHKSPISDTEYLVVGTAGSRDWIHTSFGRKIEAAIERSDTINIVSEEHWVKFL